MMRETEDAYLVAGATNEEGRTLTIPLRFLPKGKTFSAELTMDGRDADYLKNREVIQTATQTLSRTTPLTVRMAPGGGFCIVIKK